MNPRQSLRGWLYSAPSASMMCLLLFGPLLAMLFISLTD